MDNECKLGHVYDPWNEENGRAKEIAYNNGFKDFDGPIKLSHDEERKCEINVQKEHAECENKNNDGEKHDVKDKKFKIKFGAAIPAQVKISKKNTCIITISENECDLSQ